MQQAQRLHLADDAHPDHPGATGVGKDARTEGLDSEWHHAGRSTGGTLPDNLDPDEELPENIDIDEVNAQYRNGYLWICLPKQEAGGTE